MKITKTNEIKYSLGKDIKKWYHNYKNYHIIFHMSEDTINSLNDNALYKCDIMSIKEGNAEYKRLYYIDTSNSYCEKYY